MNKKLIALAVAAATVVPAAMAQTANPVTLYGRVYETLEFVKSSGNANSPLASSRVRVSDYSSFLGVRGTEDLGGGLKAFFQVETAFRADQSAATAFATRNSAVGLTGAWGSALIGRWDSPFKVATVGIDVFGDLTMGGITAALNDRGNFDRRLNDTVQYWSPTIGGFQARLAYGSNEGKTATTNPSVISYSIAYTQGPFNVGYAYERHEDQFRAYTLPPATSAMPTAGADERGSAIFGTATFGPVKVGVMAQKFKKNNGTPTPITDQRADMANVTYTLDKNQFIYQYMRSKDGAAVGPNQPRCKVNTLGYFYNFTKRTSLLAQYVLIKNSTFGQCDLATNPLAGSAAIPAGEDPRGVAVGFRHVF
ncbi:MAG: porin [Betaproteobacteria bacterium]|nr:porin [Betaproteobacteria bacterium]